MNFPRIDWRVEIKQLSEEPCLGVRFRLIFKEIRWIYFLWEEKELVASMFFFSSNFFSFNSRRANEEIDSKFCFLSTNDWWCKKKYLSLCFWLKSKRTARFCFQSKEENRRQILVSNVCFFFSSRRFSRSLVEIEENSKTRTQSSVAQRKTKRNNSSCSSQICSSKREQSDFDWNDFHFFCSSDEPSRSWFQLLSIQIEFDCLSRRKSDSFCFLNGFNSLDHRHRKQRWALNENNWWKTMAHSSSQNSIDLKGIEN